MRIAVYHHVSPGGALRALADLLSRLSRHHTIELFETRDVHQERSASPMARGLESHCSKVRVYDLPSTPRRLPLGGFAELWQLRSLADVERRIARDIDSAEFDVVFVNPCGRRYTPEILRYVTSPCVYYMQEVRRPSFEYRFTAARRAAFRQERWARRLVLRSQSAVVERVSARRDVATVGRAVARGVRVLTNSWHSAERILAAYGVEAHVCHLGVDVDRFAPGPPRSETPPGYVLAVGRVTAIKRHELTIGAVSRIPPEDRPLLVIAATPSGRAQRLLDLAARLDVAIRIDEVIEDEKLVELYRGATATVCASELEPFGLTALESIACGTPVVAVAQGGFRETVSHGINGLLAEPTPESLADAIVRVGELDRRQVRSTVLGYWSLARAGERLDAALRSAWQARMPIAFDGATGG